MIHSMSGGVITEYENLIYVFCALEGDEEQKRWYVSPFVKVKVGDRVQVPAGLSTANAKVLRVERVTAQTAPYPVKRTPEILSIL